MEPTYPQQPAVPPPFPAAPQVTPTVPPIAPPPQGNSKMVLWLALTLLFLAVICAGGYLLVSSGLIPFFNQQKACTMEAKICPDGTSVGRVGPNCEFAPCPNPTESSSPILSPEEFPTETPTASALPSPTPTFSTSLPVSTPGY